VPQLADGGDVDGSCVLDGHGFLRGRGAFG
jgi:hypothetical protein